MNIALCIASASFAPAARMPRAISPLIATTDAHAEPGEALLDRFEPTVPYFSRSASAAEIALARGVGRLAYDAV